MEACCDAATLWKPGTSARSTLQLVRTFDVRHLKRKSTSVMSKQLTLMSSGSDDVPVDETHDRVEDFGVQSDDETLKTLERGRGAVRSARRKKVFIQDSSLNQAQSCLSVGFRCCGWYVLKIARCSSSCVIPSDVAARWPAAGFPNCAF